MRNLSVIVLLLTALVVGACGSFAEPPPNSATLEAEAAEAVITEEEVVEEVAQVEPTSTPLPPTPTTLPPTATPTPLPPTPEPTEEVAALSPEEENIVFFISDFSSPDNGEILFNENYEVTMNDGSIGAWACSVCHNVNSDEAGTGPGMLNLPSNAGERVPGQPAELYIYNSIVHPNDYIVEGYDEGVMPVGYAEIFSEQELYDLAAYILSIGG